MCGRRELVIGRPSRRCLEIIHRENWIQFNATANEYINSNETDKLEINIE